MPHIILHSFIYMISFNPYDDPMGEALTPFLQFKILWVRKLISQSRQGFHLSSQIGKVRQYFSFLAPQKPCSREVWAKPG